MNIQTQLFRILNIVKTKSLEFDKKLGDRNKEPMDFYYAAYYGGAYNTAKILINIYNGDISDEELGHLIQGLDSPENERKAS